jgi:DNA transformation protein and related proteins
VDPDAIRELFAAFGPVTPRRMFSGMGIFAEGKMFGLVIGGVIHLKADETTVADFEREGAGPFSYATKHGTRTVMSYWRLPERLYDDVEELALWAQRSLEVARRAAARPRTAKQKPAAKGKPVKPKPVKPPAARRAGRIPGRTRK